MAVRDAKRLKDMYVTRMQPLADSRRLSTTGFSLVVPDQVNSPREKILYALWNVGELSFHKITLFTDLNKTTVESEILKLIHQGIVEHSSSTQSATEEMNLLLHTFRIKRTSAVHEPTD